MKLIRSVITSVMDTFFWTFIFAVCVALWIGAGYVGVSFVHFMLA